VTDAWMPGAERIPAPADGGATKGGAPRAVWLPVYANPLVLPARVVAERLIQLGRPSHLVWNPVSGEVAQLIPAIRAARALGWLDGQGWLDGPGWAAGPDCTRGTDRTRGPASSAAEPTAPAARDGLAAINTEGRICVQIAVLSQVWWPFTEGPAERLQEIVTWLDSWQVPRTWPAGRPARFPGAGPAVAGRRPAPHARTVQAEAAGTGPGGRRNWAQGGHFAAVQVPGCAAAGVGHIELDQPERDQPRIRPARPAGSPDRISARTWQPRLTPARSAAP
jgi:hypothetical protein